MDTQAVAGGIGVVPQTPLTWNQMNGFLLDFRAIQALGGLHNEARKSRDGLDPRVQ
jgi:hypothetical protein